MEKIERGGLQTGVYMYFCQKFFNPPPPPKKYVRYFFVVIFKNFIFSLGIYVLRDRLIAAGFKNMCSKLPKTGSSPFSSV